MSTGTRFGLLMIGRKWSDVRLCRLATAYEAMIQEWRDVNDKPHFMPVTELRDVVELRLREEKS